jgi:hypothetical protein
MIMMDRFPPQEAGIPTRSRLSDLFVAASCGNEQAMYQFKIIFEEVS